MKAIVSPNIRRRFDTKFFGIIKSSKLNEPPPDFINFIDLTINAITNMISSAPTIKAATWAVHGALMIVKK